MQIPTDAWIIAGLLVMVLLFIFTVSARLYRKAGFESCGPLLDYPATPFTAFFQKSLSISVPA